MSERLFSKRWQERLDRRFSEIVLGCLGDDGAPFVGGDCAAEKVQHGSDGVAQRSGDGAGVVVGGAVQDPIKCVFHVNHGPDVSVKVEIVIHATSVGGGR